MFPKCYSMLKHNSLAMTNFKIKTAFFWYLDGIPLFSVEINFHDPESKIVQFFIILYLLLLKFVIKKNKEPWLLDC